MKNRKTFAGLLGLAAIVTVAVALNCTECSTKKRKSAIEFVNDADDISISVIDEQTGEVVETTSDDILVPIEEVPDLIAKKKGCSGRTSRPLTPQEYEKIKAEMMEGRYTVMFIAKKYHLVRHQAYAIFYSIKRENHSEHTEQIDTTASV